MSKLNLEMSEVGTGQELPVMSFYFTFPKNQQKQKKNRIENKERQTTRLRLEASTRVKVKTYHFKKIQVASRVPYWGRKQTERKTSN